MSTTTAVQSLAEKIRDKLVAKVYPNEEDDVQSQAFLEIIIGLLPILADLLAQNCSPSPERLQSMLKNRPFFRWRFKKEIERRINDNDQMKAWGNDLVQVSVEVISDPENLEIVKAAMQSKPEPPPVWGVFSLLPMLLVSCVFLFGSSLLAQCPTCGNTSSSYTVYQTSSFEAPHVRSHVPTYYVRQTTPVYVVRTSQPVYLTSQSYYQTAPTVSPSSSNGVWSYRTTPVRALLSDMFNCASLGGSTSG